MAAAGAGDGSLGIGSLKRGAREQVLAKAVTP